MPNWLKLAAGLALAASLIAIAGMGAYSEKHDVLVQEHGTTFYNGAPVIATVPCRPEKEIVAAISDVHAKYDYYATDDLKIFEDRALNLKGLPPLDVEKLYVITEDDKLRAGEMVLFIGFKGACVSIVFGFPAGLYDEIVGKSRG